jgi:hypothetical protein
VSINRSHGILDTDHPMKYMFDQFFISCINLATTGSEEIMNMTFSRTFDIVTPGIGEVKGFQVSTQVSEISKITEVPSIVTLETGVIS